eukprot:366337-Chlamydomonas_euryale.AAC.6
MRRYSFACEPVQLIERRQPLVTRRRRPDRGASQPEQLFDAAASRATRPFRGLQAPSSSSVLQHRQTLEHHERRTVQRAPGIAAGRCAAAGGAYAAVSRFAGVRESRAAACVQACGACPAACARKYGERGSCVRAGTSSAGL